MDAEAALALFCNGWVYGFVLGVFLGLGAIYLAAKVLISAERERSEDC